MCPTYLSANCCISWWEQVNLQWDDDEVIFVLDQHAYSWISIVLAHRNNSSQIDMSDTLSRFSYHCVVKILTKWKQQNTTLSEQIENKICQMWKKQTRFKGIFTNKETNIMSEILLFNANSAIVQLYHGENKLICNEMMMRSSLY
jgi:hypothetical protein